jgi:hypothetical protein
VHFHRLGLNEGTAFTTLCLLTAATGYLGILVARALQPEVVLLEIKPHGINGFEALSILR